MDVEEKQHSYNFEALKLLNDWSKWLVTVESALIVAIGAIAKADSAFSGKNGGIGVFINVITALSPICAFFAIFCFLRSIFFANMLLVSIPDVVQRLLRGENGLSKHPPLPHMVDIYDKQDMSFGYKLTQLTNKQYRWFFVGLMFFTAFIVLKTGLALMPK